jgi:hypothetical protein
MALRHKRIVATLNVGNSTDWNDDHISDFTDEILIERNFITPAITAEWDLTTNGAGVAAVLTFQDHHAFCKIDSGANNTDWSCMKYEFNGAAGNITSYLDGPVITMALWLDAYSATGKVAEFGFLSNATAPFTANQSGAYFRINGNKLYSVTGTGAAETATDITPLLGISEFAQYRIELGAANCKFYMDDMTIPLRTETATLPTGDLTMAFAARNDSGTKAEVYIDAVALTRNRYQ